MILTFLLHIKVVQTVSSKNISSHAADCTLVITSPRYRDGCYTGAELLPCCV